MMEEALLDYAWLVPAFPAAGFVLISFWMKSSRKLSAGIAIALSFCSFLLSLGLAWSGIQLGLSTAEPFVRRLTWFQTGGLQAELGVLLDPLSILLLVVVTSVSLLVQIYSVGYMKGEKDYSRFFAFLCLFSASMLGLVLAVNLLQLYVCWELVGLCSYLLIGFYYGRIAAREAAKKAFITTRVGDFGLLLGILLLEIQFGTLDFPALREQVPAFASLGGAGFLTLTGVLLFLGPVGKSGQFPLHVWLPDAMEGPTPVSALIHAATMVIAGVYLIARSFFLFEAVPQVMMVIAWLGAFTALFAASIAITQRAIKRILAYSTISQLGYMMLALGAGSLSASLFHLMTHAFFKALLFLCAGAVMHALQDEADIFCMGGLRKRMPVTFAAMTIGVLAISGIPPFAGFFSKDEILGAALQVSLPLYLVASLTSFLTAFYMARLLFAAFWGEPAKGKCNAQEVSWPMRFPLLILAALSVLSGILGYEGGLGSWLSGGAVQEEMNPSVAVLSTLLALSAFGLAWNIYGSKRWDASLLALRFGRLYTWSFHKYYVDEFYAFAVQYLVDGAGRVLYWLDLHVIDGIVNGLARLTLHCSRLFSRAQSGQTQQYAAVLFVGVLLLTVYGVCYAQRLWALAGGVS